MSLAMTQDQEAIACGSTFRAAFGLIEEKAEVLSIGNDRVGIPHVKFQLEVKRGSSMPCHEQRTLALESFRSRYCARA
ncbi:MAG: hypothetical protein WBK91_06675 [Alphaproteobacteria bacterium]